MRIVFGVLAGILCAFTSGFILPSDTHRIMALYLPVIAGGWAGGFMARKGGWIIGLLVGCLNLVLSLCILVYMVALPNGLPITTGIIEVSTLPTVLVCSMAGYMGERCYRWCPVQLHLWPPRLSIGQEVRNGEELAHLSRQNR